jgi:hypothetical protein
MSRWLWGGMLLLLMVIASGWTYFDSTRLGIPGFM